MFPVFGWNEYTMEVRIRSLCSSHSVCHFQMARTSCCVNWHDRRTSYVAFLFFLFIVVYCIPLIILVTTNTITLQGLKRMREKVESGIQTALNRKRIEMERRVVRSKLAGCLME